MNVSRHDGVVHLTSHDIMALYIENGHDVMLRIEFVEQIENILLFFFFFLMIRLPPNSSLFPYPPLFRPTGLGASHRGPRRPAPWRHLPVPAPAGWRDNAPPRPFPRRSEAGQAGRRPAPPGSHPPEIGRAHV